MRRWIFVLIVSFKNLFDFFTNCIILKKEVRR